MSGEPLLALSGIRRSFDGGRIVALDGVDLSIGRGESVAVVGRSGSGKSCLVGIATGLDRPDAEGSPRAAPGRRCGARRSASSFRSSIFCRP
jgi:putative ABC transport system ATP-binding protein